MSGDTGAQRLSHRRQREAANLSSAKIGEGSPAQSSVLSFMPNAEFSRRFRTLAGMSGSAVPMSRKEFLVLSVTANPEPCYYIVLQNTEGSVPKGDPNGPDVFIRINALEMERRMKGILLPKAIGFTGALLDVFRERSICSPE